MTQMTGECEEDEDYQMECKLMSQITSGPLCSLQGSDWSAWKSLHTLANVLNFRVMQQKCWLEPKLAWQNWDLILIFWTNFCFKTRDDDSFDGAIFIVTADII